MFLRSNYKTKRFQSFFASHLSIKARGRVGGAGTKGGSRPIFRTQCLLESNIEDSIGVKETKAASVESLEGRSLFAR